MILAVLAVAASAPSFDCTKASTKVEKMICADERLARSDQAVAILFRSAVAQKINLERKQRDWLQGRNECADEICLLDAYEWRIGELLGLTDLGNSYVSGPNQTLSILSLGNGWYAFSATGIWIGSVKLGQVNDAEASGVFRLVDDRGSRAPTSDVECGWKMQGLPRNRWKLEDWPGSTHTPCGGVNATIEGVYR